MSEDVCEYLECDSGVFVLLSDGSPKWTSFRLCSNMNVATKVAEAFILDRGDSMLKTDPVLNKA